MEVPSMEKNDSHTPNAQKDQDVRLSRFMANVSHDLKTPLNAVVGFSSLLLQTDETLSEEALHQLQLIDKNARKLLVRLDAMVEFFRLRAGLITSQPEWLRPAEVISTLIREHSDVMNKQKNEFILIENTIPSRIFVVRSMFTRIFSELISNAMRYTLDGSVNVHAQIQPGSGIGRTRISFSVSDTGSNLSEQLIIELSAALSEGFADQSAIGGTIFNGLGLGLALAREAAGCLGGRLRVEGRSPRGSRFSLDLELDDDHISQ